MIRKIGTRHINYKVELGCDGITVQSYSDADIVIDGIKEVLAGRRYRTDISFDEVYVCPCCGTETLDIRYLNYCCNKYPEHCDKCNKRFKCYTEDDDNI
jgi:hypothetical protein